MSVLDLGAMNNLGALLSLLVAFQLFFVAFYLLTHKKGNKRNNRILGVVFLLFAVSWTDFTMRVVGVTWPIPLLHLFDDGFFLLYGPILYFYVQGVAYRDFHFERKHVFHLLPFFGYTFFLLYHLVTMDVGTQSQFFEQVDGLALPSWVYGLAVVPYLHILGYLWVSRKIVQGYESVIKEKYSSIEEINLNWLSFMVNAFAVITILAMIHNVLPVLGNVLSHYSSLVVLLIISLVFINRVLVKALNQPAIFSGIGQTELEKYASSNLSAADVHQYKKQLTRLMAEEKLYLNPELTSQDLAERLGIPPKTLSQVINQGFGKSFFDFVNTYRCEEVQRILQGPDKRVTVLEAMYQAGFNSKSSFNKEFKKLTGHTPSEFKRSVSSS